MVNLVTSPEGACYPWSYIAADPPQICDDDLVRKAREVVLPWLEELKQLHEKFVKSHIKIRLPTLVHAVGIALLPESQSHALNFRRDKTHLSHSHVTVPEANGRRVFLKYRKLKSFEGSEAKVSRCVSFFVPDNVQELQFQKLIKLSLQYKSPKEGDTLPLYRRMSLMQRLAAEKKGVALYATVKASTLRCRQKVYFYQEEGQDLLDLIEEKLLLKPEIERRKYAVDIAKQVSDLHEQKILHNDVKPENFIVMHDGHIKIIDFAFSRKSDDPLLVQCSFGTINYTSPEQFRYCLDHDRGELDPFAWDNFGLGLTLHRLIDGRDHAWYDLANEYDEKLGKYINGKEEWTEKAVSILEKLDKKRCELAEQMAKDAEKCRPLLGKSVPSVIFCLLDSNPGTRLKSREAHTHLVALANS